MKDKLKQFWNEPVNRFWLTCAFGTLFALCFGIYSFFEKSLNPVISLGLISIALIFEILFLIALIINTLADTTREYLEAFQEINRDLRYGYYQKKNRDKDYKGPSWNDEEFSKITDLKARVNEFVKASIEYQQVDFKGWKERNIDTNLDSRKQTISRITKMFFAAIFSLLILFALLYWLEFNVARIKNLLENSRSPVLVALITTIITSPIIFTVWVFRDKNNRVQIANARKDTNLKDFQKLSEWASGFHLPEPKHAISTKNMSKTGKDGQENTEETTTSQEDFIAPDNSNSISRRQGAEALQASAIAQLEAFMFGKYGEQFMQPAFLLIHSIWESIITQQQARYSDEEFKHVLEQLHKNPIITALNKALTGAGGNHLRLFEITLENLKFTGLSVEQFSAKKINFCGMTLCYTNFSHCTFTSSRFIKSDLSGASLTYTNFFSSDMQKIIFNFSKIKEVKFSLCDMYSSEFISAELINTDFSSSNLEYADFSHAKFKNVTFDGADLKNSSFIDSEINEKDITTMFNKTKINRYTSFDHFSQHANVVSPLLERILFHGAIWDDDPNWLVGKIQDKNLLEKIFKDCEERRKYQN
ncbi:hypothetical protein BKE30_00795 [Alkanindiges hydrocarboniclasticus]|uniref:Pentapeptide repeat protein n=1 Tax=Alkanindiges hydrocarboniclasticus TaxID=1907941 RepID=A0A1S8CZP5_9GAMM|nr:pentapeptide repeat-containing protein [Alkanindiges hydrocarboniclasticus]ONG42076.1 hypothetical protein BKE30_00795 [Alkanindiges hydrocarboniclasticus]